MAGDLALNIEIPFVRGRVLVRSRVVNERRTGYWKQVGSSGRKPSGDRQGLSEVRGTVGRCKRSAEGGILGF